ncbi:MAG: hypothetical protein ACP5E2_07435 [Terracidiphilus sp.]
MDSPVAHEALMMLGPLVMIVVVVALAIILIPFWFICRKAGFSPWLTLLNIIPLGNLVLIYVLAFAEWKVVPAAQLAPNLPPYQPPYPPAPPTA